MKNKNQDTFPLSRFRKLKGTRRLAREKCLQVLVAYYMSGSDVEELYNHIFSRKFNFGDEVQKGDARLLKPDEIFELEADVPIIWKNDETKFGWELIKETISNSYFIDELINKFAKNWELERIALIDRVLIRMASTEMLKFPEIPPKVSINEALDIAKKYSTGKSSIFINGVLDSILNNFKEDGLLKKTGRGLIND